MFNSEGLHSVSCGGTSFGAPRTDYTMVDNSFQSSLSTSFVGGSRLGRFSSSRTSSNGYAGNATTSNTVSYSGGSVISTRTSKKFLSSFGDSGSSSTSSSSTGGGSFVSSHRSVASSVIPEMPYYNSVSNSGYIEFPDEKDDGYVPPTGELDPEFASPIGDVLLPMMLMACVYAVVRIFKNFKIKHSAKKDLY